MSGAVHSLSFQDLVDAVESMPLDDQSMLVELINKRIMRNAGLSWSMRYRRLDARLKEVRLNAAHLKT